MLRGTGFAIQVDGYVFVAEPQLANKGAQILDGIGHIFRRIDVEFLVIDRQDEGACPALLLGKRTQVAVAGYAQHLDALGLDGSGERSNAKPRGILGAIVFVDDDDRKTKFHAVTPWSLLKLTARATETEETAAPALRTRQGYALLPLILAAPIAIRSLADFIAIKEQHLRAALASIDFGGQRRGVRKFEH